MQEEAQLVQLEDYEPDLDEDEIKEQEEQKAHRMTSSSQNPSNNSQAAARIEAQKRQRRIMKKRKKNTVSFKYNIKLARIPPKPQWGSWLTSLFGSKKGVNIKDLAHVEHVPEQENCPKNEYHTTVQAGQTAFI